MNGTVLSSLSPALPTKQSGTEKLKALALSTLGEICQDQEIVASPQDLDLRYLIDTSALRTVVLSSILMFC